MGHVDPDLRLDRASQGGPDPAPDPERDRIDLLAEEFAARCRRGEQPSVSEYAARHPEHAAQIHAALPAVALMEQLKQHRQNPVRDGAALDFEVDADADADAAVPPPTIERLGELRLIREIGRGGMGIVYEAVQESLGRRVALKLLPRHAFLDARTLQRFQREAQAIAQLQHPHIVPIFGVGEEEGLHYYIMQLINGRGLHQVIRALRRGVPLSEALAPSGTSRAADPVAEQRRPPQPAADPAAIGRQLDDHYWRFAARVALQVAEALEYAHGQGVLHRDIKPANLLLDDRGVVWVTDFGLAKLAQQGDITITGDIIGTLQYMAPEGLQGESDARSDVYGLGMTLYELLTLAPPFDESNPSRLIRRVGEESPIQPRKRNPAIPRDLETIVLKATASAPVDRYPTARALADDLARFLDDRPVRARRATLAEQLGRWCRRNKALAALGAVALGSLVFAAVVGWAGYATTRRALAGESQRRREADAATRRAEANVALSLQALEEIFNSLTPHTFDPSFGPDDHGPPPDEPGEPPGGRGPGSGSGPGPGAGPGWDQGPPLGREVVNGQTALLQSILGFYDRFAALNETNATLKREAAKAHRRIGELRQRLCQFDAADAAFGRAATLFEALAREFPERPDDRHALAETLIVHEPRSDSLDAPEQAVARWQRARAIEEELARGFPDTRKYPAAQAAIETKLGTLLDQIGRTSDAEPCLRRAVALRSALAEQSSDGSYTSLLLALARTTLGRFLLEHNQPAEARTCLNACAAELRVIATKELPPDASGVLAAALDNLAALYKTLGESARAAEMTRLARGLRDFGPDGPHPGPHPPRGHGPGPGPGGPGPGHEHDPGHPPPPPGDPWDDGPGHFPPKPRGPHPRGGGA